MCLNLCTLKEYPRHALALQMAFLMHGKDVKDLSTISSHKFSIFAHAKLWKLCQVIYHNVKLLSLAEASFPAGLAY